MAPRQQLQDLLKTILGSDKVYFQPPANLQMVYPCIVYSRDAAHNDYADNGPYLHKKRYQVTIIDPNPDSDIPDLVALMPLCVFNRYFVNENLHHDVYSLYF